MICDCGSDNWEAGSDIHTGSTFYRCRHCGRLAATGTSWVDWKCGLFLSFENDLTVCGSAWTQQVGPQLFCSGSWSRLTTYR